ncbi:hypothetical protein J0695_40760, partial [Streptomyces beijiangensis]|nr:hypothetical protein [Streptomyces beijiangensis]
FVDQDEPSLGMSPPVAAATYTMLLSLAARSAAVVIAEQGLPPGLDGRTPVVVPVVVHQLRRGSVVFSGEPAELTAG